MWDRAFSYQTPLLWNQLTVWMWEIETLTALKIRLNTFPFDKRFSQVTLNGSIVMLLLAQTATGLCALQCITLSASSLLLLTPMSPRTSRGDMGVTWQMAARPWTLVLLEISSVKRKFFIPTVTKCFVHRGLFDCLSFLFNTVGSL